MNLYLLHHVILSKAQSQQETVVVCDRVAHDNVVYRSRKMRKRKSESREEEFKKVSCGGVDYGR